MTTEGDIELIEAYRNGTLSETDRKSVEQRLKGDTAFAELYDTHTWTLDAFEGMQMEELEDSLREVRTKPPSRAMRGWWYLLGALLVALILFVVIREQKLRNSVTPAVLAEAYYEKPVSLVERSEDPSVPETLSQAFTSYAEEDWEQAIALFRSVSTSQYQKTATYYEAHCRYQLGQFDEARVLFLELSGDPQYRQQAGWFAAICALQEGQLAEAKNELNQIQADDANFYADEAKQVLEQLH